MKLYQKKILILHGWGSCAKNWTKVKELLEKKGLEVFAPDLPGFGKCPLPTKPWSIDDYVEWIKNFCSLFAEVGFAEVGPPQTKFYLLGHSFGGRIAIKFAIKYPEKLKSLILNSAAGITPRPKFKIFIFCFFSKIGNLIFSLPILKFLRPFCLKIAYLLGAGRDYQMIQNSTMRETFKKTIGEDLTSCLSQITIPTLLIWGAKDRLIPVSDAYLMKKEIKNSRLKIIPNIGHAANLEAPEKLAEIIIQSIK